MSARTLLLVDDEENISSALTRLLRRDGYQILRATGGKEGLELLQQNDVGVIISDQRMPGMTGVEFLGEVKERYPDTVRIVLSGYTDLNSVTDAINRGAVYKFLTKPWDDDLLRKNVADAFLYFELKMENTRLARELQSANDRLQAANKSLENQITVEVGNARNNQIVLELEREIIDNLPIGVLGVDDDGLLVIVNCTAQQLFSQYGDLVAGSFIHDVLPQELTKILREEFVAEGESRTVRIGETNIQVFCNRLGRRSDGCGMILTFLPKGNTGM